MQRKIVLLMVFALAINTLLAYSWESIPTQRILQHGSSGEDVRELQTRLKQLDYYTSPVDGKYGWNTYWAVRKFQSDYGLTIDGIAGVKTWSTLKNNTYIPTPTTNPKGFSDQDISLLVHLVHGEARGESYTGQVAVAAVVLNRIKSSHFPNTVSGVIFEPRAFTAVDDGQIWIAPSSPEIRKAVIDAINGWDPSSGALYYFNPDTATSAWIWSRPQIKKIGKHIFCR